MKYLSLLLIVVLTLGVPIFTYNIYMEITHPVKYQDWITEYSAACEIEPSLVASIINVESSYDTNAVSKKGAVGLCQLLPSTAQYVINYYGLNDKEINLTDAETNIKLATLYLKYLYKKFDKTEIVLASYNAGETVVRTWINEDKELSNIPYKETKNYISKVLNNQAYYIRKYKN